MHRQEVKEVKKGGKKFSFITYWFLRMYLYSELFSIQPSRWVIACWLSNPCTDGTHLTLSI